MRKAEPTAEAFPRPWHRLPRWAQGHAGAGFGAALLTNDARQRKRRERIQNVGGRRNVERPLGGRRFHTNDAVHPIFEARYGGPHQALLGRRVRRANHSAGAGCRSITIELCEEETLLTG